MQQLSAASKEVICLREELETRYLRRAVRMLECPCSIELGKELIIERLVNADAADAGLTRLRKRRAGRADAAEAADAADAV